MSLFNIVYKYRESKILNTSTNVHAFVWGRWSIALLRILKCMFVKADKILLKREREDMYTKSLHWV